ncbi:MAG: hypothetical protein WBG23_06075 [Acidobacteriaceae bacterium]
MKLNITVVAVFWLLISGHGANSQQILNLLVHGVSILLFPARILSLKFAFHVHSAFVHFIRSDFQQFTRMKILRVQDGIAA